MAQRPTLYALLVGINEYDPECGLPPLRGCVNDVRALSRLLIDHYGVPAENVLCLVDSAATAAAIQNAFQQHLIGNARHWQAQESAAREAAPAFLFHFSGYGSQMRDMSGRASGGMDATLVAHDSRVPGVFDIRDWELGEWIAQLNTVTEDVTVILDCCQTSTHTELDDAMPRVRACPPDLRAAPWQRPPQPFACLQRSLSPSRWETGAAHLLVSACRAGEMAYEHALVLESNAQGAEGETVWHGALSWYVQQTLAESPVGRAHTGSELQESVRSRVTAVYARQTPQCEGDLDAAFWGGLAREEKTLLVTAQDSPGRYWLDAGLAQGIRAGSRLRVANGEGSASLVTDAQQQPLPLGELVVVREGVERSECVPQATPRHLPEQARAFAVQHAPRSAQRGVRILLQSPRARVHLAQRISTRLHVPWLEAWLRPVAQGEDLRVEERPGGVFLCDRSGAALAGPYDADDTERIARDLAHLARYRNVLQLRNDAPSAALMDALHVAVKRLDTSGIKPAVVAIPPGAEGEETVFTGTRIVIEAGNRGEQPLYIALLALTPACEVRVLYPPADAQPAPLLPGKQVSLGLSADVEGQILCQLPAGMMAARTQYKAIASTLPFDPAQLRQDALGALFPATSNAHPSSFDTLLQRAVDGVVSPADTMSDDAGRNVAVKGMTQAVETPADVCDWIVRDARLTVLAAPAALAVETFSAVAPDSAERARLGSDAGLRVVAPANFTGRVRYLSSAQAIHLHGTESMQAPPGLAAFPELFASLDLPDADQGVATAHGVIEIDCDDAARRAISSQTPLLLHLPPQDAVALMALACDGRNWYPVGRAPGNARQIAVEWLPRPQEARQDSGVEGRMASPARVVRIFLYRILEEPVSDLGLFNVRFVPQGWTSFASRASFVRKVAGGDLRYTPAVRFQARERVALLVHGLGGDSAPLALWLATTLAELGVQYDRILAFEYESVGTSVKENASLLAQKLAALGIRETQDVAIDIFAHSMGALVARTYVETMGGDKYVRNTIMMASPNLGTPLADVALLVPWLITLAVNLPLPTPSGLLVGWAMGALASEARGVADLGVRSQLLEALNAGDRRALVRYYLLAGDSGLNEEAADAEDGEGGDAETQSRADVLLRTLAEGITHLSEWYFSDANDLVVAVRSSIGARVQQASGSVLLTRVMRCNHFGFFESEAVALQVVRWLQEASAAQQTAPEEPAPSRRRVIAFRAS